MRGRTVESMARRHNEDVPSITSASDAQSRLIDKKEREYLIQMAIRVVCFVGFSFIDHPIRWVLLLGAIILPYTAVVISNSSIRNKGDGPSPFGGSTTAVENKQRSISSESSED